MLTEADLLRAWNRCHGAFFQLREADLRWNLEKQEWLRYWTANLADVPVLWAEPAAPGLALGLPPDGIWLSFYGEIPAGQEPAFARAAEDFARSRGKVRLGFGGEEFHFLPGVPVEDERLVAALRAQGFSAADCADFVGAPSNPQSTEYIASALRECAQRGWEFSRVAGDRASADLEEFLGKEFPGRWHREWKVWAARADTRCAFWNLLRDERGRVLGFSRLAHRETAGDWAPGALRLPLDPVAGARPTDSCLGPIGIAKNERGRGAGKVLLGLSLHELSLHGAERTCIDWTNAYNYYTPLGFSVVRHYFSMWKNL